MAAARRSINLLCRSATSSRSAPKSLETAPSSKSARTVKPAMVGKRNWVGVELRMGLVSFKLRTKRYLRNSHYINGLSEIGSHL